MMIVITIIIITLTTTTVSTADHPYCLAASVRTCSSSQGLKANSALNVQLVHT